MKNVLLTLVALSFCSSLAAKQITTAEALARFKGYEARGRMGVTPNNADYKLAYTATDNNKNIFYVLNNTTTPGFVILGADDCVPALIGYSSSTFNTEEMPVNMKEWLDSYKTSFSAMIDANYEARAKASQTSAIEPLIKSKWSQNEPFYNTCQDKTGISTVAGCGAIAIGQIMNYYKYPAAGTGSHSYTSMTNKFNLSADFNEKIDWSLMKNCLGNYIPENSNTTLTESYTDTEAKAVADFIYKCGVAVEMDYMVDYASSANGIYGAALINYFGYDRGMEHLTRAYYPDSKEWEGIIIEELENGRPVLYAAKTPGNFGHAFICDGFDGNGYFHINWGWGGLYDGYYLLTGNDALSPNETNSYTETHTMTIGIQPAKANSVAPVKMIAPHGFCILSSEQEIMSGDKVRLNSNGTYYMYGGFFSETLVNSEIALGVKFTNDNDEYFDILSVAKDVKMNQGITSIPFYTSCIQKKGVYDIVPICAPADCDLTDLNNWKAIQCETEGSQYTHGKVELSGELPNVTVEYAYVNNKENITTKNDFLLNIKFKALRTFDKRDFLIWVIDEETGNSVTYANVNIAMKEGESIVLSNVAFTGGLKNIEAGKKYKVLMEDYNSGLRLTPTITTTFTISVTESAPTIIDLTDSQIYTNESSKQCETINYTRTFTNTNWQALYVPFAITYDEFKDDFEIGYIHNLEIRDVDSDGTVDDLVLELETIKDGEATNPNTPYFIKAKSTGTKTITVNNTTLCAAEQNSLEFKTQICNLSFTGTYSGINGEIMYNEHLYGMSNGLLCNAIDDTVVLSPYRWFLSIKDANNMYYSIPSANIRIRIKDSEANAIESMAGTSNLKDVVFTLDGRRVKSSNMKAGIYIVNGKKKIVK